MSNETCKGILIAGIKSGSGKTMFTCSLLEALKERQKNPCAFKCGPDYIDPMFHQKVIGIPSCNLDSFFSDEEQLRDLYQKQSEGHPISVIEGVMGLYDGLGGTQKQGSAYDLASILKIPVILVIDVHGMGRSILPLIAGFLQYDKEKRIKGVILNKISKGFYETISPLIEEELKTEVLGYLPKMKELSFESRHLGLQLPGEIKGLKEELSRAAGILEETVSVDRLLEIADSDIIKKNMLKKKKKDRVRIAVARDEAFCFYYEENLNRLREEGAELVEFSPLYDKELPKDIDALLLGGGYPELFAELLEKNDSMRRSIKEAITNKMPSVAECGGFMYLHSTLTDKEGNCHSMCGLIPGNCHFTGRLVRFGYVEVEEISGSSWLCGKKIKAHEFHYFDSEANGEDCRAVKPTTQKSWSCIHASEDHFWGFPHLYYASNLDFVTSFINKALEYRKNREGFYGK